MAGRLRERGARVYLVLTSALAALWPARASAYSCIPEALADRLGASSHAFVGEVVKIDASEAYVAKVTWRIVTAFKGPAQGMVVTPYRGSVWQGPVTAKEYPPKTRHLVFAKPSAGKPALEHPCGPMTIPEAKATAELKELPALVAADRKTREATASGLAKAKAEPKNSVKILAALKPSRLDREIVTLELGRAKAAAKDYKGALAEAVKISTVNGELKAEGIFNGMCYAALDGDVMSAREFLNDLRSEVVKPFPEEDEAWAAARATRFGKLMAEDADLASLRNEEPFPVHMVLLQKAGVAAQKPLAARRKRLAEAEQLIADGRCKDAKPILEELRFSFLLVQTRDQEYLTQLRVQCK